MSTPIVHENLLGAIVAATVVAVRDRSASRPLAVVERQARERQPRAAGFREALARTDRINVIAECKRRSPSRGVLRQAYDPPAIACAYVAAGAAAISVLTEPMFFDGDLAHLTAVRDVVDLPILRKDFVLDRYQLAEARAAGADAVLLIVAALDDERLKALLDTTREYELAPVVEVHERGELTRAIDAGAEIIGVNNRNLRTLEVSLHCAHDLADALPANALAIAESGLRTGGDLLELRRKGYQGFLIGERFVTSPDPGAALAELLAAADPGRHP